MEHLVQHPRSVRFTLVPATAGLLLGACTVMPVGPSVMALPGPTKTIEQYQADSAACQQRASALIAASAGATAAVADNQAAQTAAASTVWGATTGALIGAATYQGAEGAAIGAVTGLLFGALAGSSYTNMSSYQLQRGYDRTFLDCMHASGNKVPMMRGYAYGPPRPGHRYPVPSEYSPYPPPDEPPPPAALRPRS